MFQFNWKTICLATAIVMAGAASAQTGMNMQSNTTRGNIWADDTEVTRGLRIGIHKAFNDVDLKLEAKNSYDSESDSANFEHNMGFTIGYGVIKANQVGFMGALALDEIETDIRFVRLEGGVSYGFGYSGGYGLAGLNINSVSVSDSTVDLDPALGLQIGAGYQINPNIGLEGKYVMTRNTKSIGTTTVELSSSMLQMGFIATF